MTNVRAQFEHACPTMRNEEPVEERCSSAIALGGGAATCTGAPKAVKVSVSVVVLGPVGNWANAGNFRAAADRRPLKYDTLRALHQASAAVDPDHPGPRW